jgi:4-amino-4-deoxychorismate lyase
VTLAILVNGITPKSLTHALPANDRGFHYGDGLFETALLDQGVVRYLDAHLERLQSGCERLGITPPDRDQIRCEIDSVTGKLRSGVLKVVLSRGIANTRGYRPEQSPTAATRVVALYAAPEPPSEAAIKVRWCETPLGRNARLAGIKHLNRLEQVLAQAEWDDGAVGEGLMLDTEGELVCGTASNVFIVRNGTLFTPDLRFCGVRGVMRSQVLRAAAECGMSVSEEPLWPSDAEAAEEMFVTNAVRGIRSVRALGSLRWERFDCAQSLKAALGV